MTTNALRRFSLRPSSTYRRSTMAIKHERPAQRRMMLQFDRTFLDFLPVFKGGLGGNELPILLDEVKGMGLVDRDHLSILDVGSADGDWLQKATSTVWGAYERRKIKFTALEPVVENPKLEKFCEDNNIQWEPNRIEESELPDESFDVITSTHCAYYFYNQPLAHEEMWRLLKPGGKLIVTLVSQTCVLNHLTRELLQPHRQFTLTAEAYMSLMAQLGLFTLERVASYKGGLLDDQFYRGKEENLRALGNVLARHRLRQGEVEQEIDRFAESLQKHRSKRRLNLIMFFEKAYLDESLVLQRGTANARLGAEGRGEKSKDTTAVTQISDDDLTSIVEILARQASDTLTFSKPQDFFQDLVETAALPDPGNFAGQWQGNPEADARRLIKWLIIHKKLFPVGDPRAGEPTLGWLLKTLLDKRPSSDDGQTLMNIILKYELITNSAVIDLLRQKYGL